MNIDDVKNAACDVAYNAQRIAQTIGTICCTLAVIAVAPVVSLVALPIIALKTAYTAIESRILYEKTLTDHTRAAYGRTPEQNYTRWDGKDAETQVTGDGQYLHGCPNGEPTLNAEGYGTPFNTEADAEWLSLEYRRREAEHNLKREIDLIILVAIGIIPIVGVVSYAAYAAIYQKFGDKGTWDLKNDTAWNWRAAIHYHEENLQKRLQRA